MLNAMSSASMSPVISVSDIVGSGEVGGGAPGTCPWEERSGQGPSNSGSQGSHGHRGPCRFLMLQDHCQIRCAPAWRHPVWEGHIRESVHFKLAKKRPAQDLLKPQKASLSVQTKLYTFKEQGKLHKRSRPKWRAARQQHSEANACAQKPLWISIQTHHRGTPTIFHIRSSVWRMASKDRLWVLSRQSLASHKRCAVCCRLLDLTLASRTRLGVSFNLEHWSTIS